MKSNRRFSNQWCNIINFFWEGCAVYHYQTSSTWDKELKVGNGPNIKSIKKGKAMKDITSHLLPLSNA